MKSMTWTKPQFRELNLSMEIGMYYEDGERPPDFEFSGDLPSTPSQLADPIRGNQPSLSNQSLRA